MSDENTNKSGFPQDETERKLSGKDTRSSKPKLASDVVEDVTKPKAESADLKAFKAVLRPLMATVMNAKLSGHPDFHAHLQRLSDLIQND